MEFFPIFILNESEGDYSYIALANTNFHKCIFWSQAAGKASSPAGPLMTALIRSLRRFCLLYAACRLSSTAEDGRHCITESF